MADLKITLELRLTQRMARWGLAAALLACCAPELASENVTLTTYYPAPSGVYTQMITTANTYLARDGGGVAIGTTVQNGALNVPGTVNIGQTWLNNSDIYFNNTGHNHTGLGNTAGYAAIENAANYNTLMILGRSGGIGGGRSVSVWDRLDVNGNEYVNAGNVQVGNGGSNTGIGVFTQNAGGACSNGQDYGTNNCAQGFCCPGGQYATLVSGVMSKYTMINDPTNVNGQMLCCPCPNGSCPGL